MRTHRRTFPCLYLVALLVPAPSLAQNLTFTDYGGFGAVQQITFEAPNIKWLAEESSGLARFDGTSTTFYTTSNSGLPDNNVHDVKIDSFGNKWIATNDGLAKFDGTTWTVYRTSNSGIPFNTIKALAIGGNNHIWVGTYGRFLAEFDGNATWTRYDNNNTPMTDGDMYSLAFDHNGVLWAGTQAELCSYDGATWRRWNPTNSPLPHPTVGNIWVDPLNRKWISSGSPAGVAVFDGTNWTIYDTSNSPLPHDAVMGVTFVANNYWIATYGGLARFDGVGSWTTYNTSNTNLHSDWVRVIGAETPNRLWLADASSELATIDLPTTFTITTNAGTGGSISPNGAVAVVKGGSQTFNILPDSCNVITSLKLDGSGITPLASYTFNNVQANHTLTATFGRAIAATPARLEAWWTFDDLVAVGVMRDLAHFNSGSNRGLLMGGATLVPAKIGQGLRCLTAGSGMTIQPTNGSIFIGNCGFAVDAWINLQPGSPPAAMRTIFSTDDGFNFFVRNGQLGLGQLQTSMAPLTTGVWHHVAVTQFACGTGPPQTSFYVDGVRVATLSQAAGYSGTTNAFVGRSPPGTTAFNGDIDEIDLFRASYLGVQGDSAVIRKIWAAGCAGKRREFVRLPLWTALNDATNSKASACAVFTNLTGATQNYSWSIPNTGTCQGAVLIGPPGGSVSVASGGTGLATVQMQRQSPGAGFCFFRVNANNVTTPNSFFTDGGVQPVSPIPVQIHSSGCQLPTLVAAATPAQSSRAPGSPGGLATAAQFIVANEGDTALSFSYRVEAVDGDTQEPSEDVVLDDLPTGTPDTATVTIPPRDSIAINVDVFVDSNSPFRTDQIVLSADLDGDTVLEPLVSNIVEAAEDTTAPVLAVGPQRMKPSTTLTASPNPFRAGTSIYFSLDSPRAVEVAVYDVLGRRVQSLYSGRLTKGMHYFTWDGRSAAGVATAPGIYFLRFDSMGLRLGTKVVQAR
jgi:hypothetical protein